MSQSTILFLRFAIGRYIEYKRESLKYSADSRFALLYITRAETWLSAAKCAYKLR